MGVLDDDCDGTLYGSCVIRGKVTPDNKPASPFWGYLKYQQVRPVLLQCLDLEVGEVLVENGHPSVVLDWRIGHEDAIARRRACVNPIYYFSILEEPQVEIGLGHPPQCRLDYSVPSIPYIICTKTYNRFLFPSCISYNPHHMFSCGPAHFLLMVGVYPWTHRLFSGTPYLLSPPSPSIYHSSQPNAYLPLS